MQAPDAEAARSLFAANRARGRVAVELAAVGGVSRAMRTHEEGSLRVRFPATCGGGPEAVLVNTAGGVAGGDCFSIDLVIGANAGLTVSTASAEKVYRSLGPPAKIDMTASLSDGAVLTWLPHETILFDRARLERHVTIGLAPTAKLVFAETAVFGRSAMGESVTDGTFFDCWRVRRGERLVFAENFRLDGAIAAHLKEAAIAKGGIALGTLLLIPGNDDMTVAVRAITPDCRGEVGISVWNGIAVARFVAPDGAILRNDLVRVLSSLGTATLPRLWLN